MQKEHSFGGAPCAAAELSVAPQAVRIVDGWATSRNPAATDRSPRRRPLPAQPAAIAALRRYLRRRDRPVPVEPTAAVFTSAAGTRLTYCNVHLAFKRIVRHAGLRPRSAACRPRPHDLRHTFAINTILDAYRSGDDVQARLPLLSTYLGHVHPGSTYWYLQAAPELLALAGQRLEQHLQEGSR